MSAFNDVRCKCGKKIGWMGKASDRPKCPKCGDRPSDSELKKADAQIERDIALLDVVFPPSGKNPYEKKRTEAKAGMSRAQAMHDLTLAQARRIVSDLDGIDPQKVADVLGNECLTEEKKVEKIADLLARS